MPPYQHDLYCIVCKNKQKPLYSFPADEEYKLKWCEAIKIRRDQVKTKAKLCIKHFSKNQLVNIRLKQKVVPWRNLPMVHPDKEIEQKTERCDVLDEAGRAQQSEEEAGINVSSQHNEQHTVTTFVIYEYS